MNYSKLNLIKETWKKKTFIKIRLFGKIVTLNNHDNNL